MELECVIPYVTTEGFEYLLKFTPFAPQILPDGISCTIVDLTIEANKEFENINNVSSLFSISGIIEDYLAVRDVYCIVIATTLKFTKAKVKADLQINSTEASYFHLCFTDVTHEST